MAFHFVIDPGSTTVLYLFCFGLLTQITVLLNIYIAFEKKGSVSKQAEHEPHETNTEAESGNRHSEKQHGKGDILNLLFNINCDHELLPPPGTFQGAKVGRGLGTVETGPCVITVIITAAAANVIVTLLQ